MYVLISIWVTGSGANQALYQFFSLSLLSSSTDDYSVDPHETNNVVNDPAYASQVQALQATLHGLVPNATSSSAARPSASTLDLLGQHH